MTKLDRADVVRYAIDMDNENAEYLTQLHKFTGQSTNDLANNIIANTRRDHPLYIETKSKRVALLMQPSLHAKLQAKAQAEHVSVNELIHSALAALVNHKA